MPTDLLASISHYKILKELGCSSFSTVYLAQPENADKAEPVALKVLDGSAVVSQESLKQLRREVRLAAKLKHPHIIRIYNTHKGQEKPFFIAMEYVAGGTLRERLKKGRLPRAETIRIVEQIGAALSHAHTHQVIHGDVRPGNILLDITQSPARSVLTDFGWTKGLSSAWLKKGDSPGQPVSTMVESYGYLAPEQWQAQELAPATDVYALALILFEMLAGQRPFKADSLSKLRQKHLHEPLPPLSRVAYKIGPFFDEILMKATAKDPADRYQSVVDFIENVKAANEEVEQAERGIQQRRATQAVKMARSYLTRDHYNLERAVALTEQALEIYPGYGEAQKLKGQIRLKQERFAEALEDYRQTYEQGYSSSSAAGLDYLRALRQSAETLWQRHDDQEAIKYYQAISQMLAAAQTEGAAVQAWLAVWTELVESHHSAGATAYIAGDGAHALGRLDELAKAQRSVGREIKALEALRAEAESQDLQEKVGLLRAKFHHSPKIKAYTGEHLDHKVEMAAISAEPTQGMTADNMTKQVVVEEAAISAIPAQASSISYHIKPRTNSRDSSFFLKSLLLLLLIPVLLLSTLCVVAQMIVRHEVSKIAIEKANTLITVPTPHPTPASPPSVQPPLAPGAERSLPLGPFRGVGTTTPLPPPTVAALVQLPSVSPPENTVPALLTPSLTFTLIPTITPTPTPAPVYGSVTTPASQRLNVREGPSVAYNTVTRLESGDKVIILGRTPDGAWLEIETPDHQRGWVTSQYVEVSGDINTVSIATNLAPTPTVSPLRTLNIEGGSIAGQLAPGQEQWYTFFEENEETVLVLIFTPPIRSNQVQFFLHDQKQIPVWPPKNPEVLASIGASSYPASDRDGNEHTIELVWRGGPLVPGVRYYLRFINQSDRPIQYCLVAKDAYQWNCP